MKKRLFHEAMIERTLEERAMDGLYAFCSQIDAKEKKKLKKGRRTPNRNMRWVGH